MPGEICQFDNFELDQDSHELRRAGSVVRIERIPLELLFLLVERRGQVVGREEILGRVWGKGVFVDAENSINTAVRKLRRTLNDDADAPRFIITVPSRGYRFNAAACVASAAPAQLPLSRAAFIGRESEMTELRAGLTDTASGRLRLFLISGEPGIGKTRLVRELAAMAVASGMAVLAGQCSEHDEAVPYLPFVEIIERCIERASNPDHLRTMLRDEGPELAKLLPKLKRILPDLPPPLELPPEQARRHLFNCFCDFVARLAKERPTLLILEDFHWADDSTLSLLGHLTQRLSEVPLLVAVTYRDAEFNVTRELAKTLEDLLRGRLAMSIRLDGLQRDEVAHMLRSLSGQVPPETVANEIYDETQGNPFFVEELFRYLEEENRLYGADGVFRTELKIAEGEVPQSVRLVVGRRLGRLSDRTRKILGTAATIGRLFNFELLEASTGTDADTLLECVDEAERAGLIFSGAENPKARLEFSHELVRQAVLSGLSAARRQRLHLEVAEAIERVNSNALEDHYSDLAYHYSRGDNVAKAAEYLGRTGRQAMQRCAYADAISSLTTAIGLLQKLPDSPERTQSELFLQLAVGQALIAVKGQAAPELGRAFTRARELCERLGDPPELFPALWGLWLTHLFRGEIRTAYELAERLLRRARGAHDPALLMYAQTALGATSYWTGELLAAREHLEMALSLYDRERHRALAFRYAGTDAAVRCLSVAARTLWQLGYPDQALKRGNEALASAEALFHPQSLAWAATFVGVLRQYRRDARAAQEAAEGAIELSAERGFSDFLARATILRGWAMAEQGRNEEGIALIQEGLAASRATGAELWRPYSLCLLAEASMETGCFDDGLSALTEALAAADEHENRPYEAEMHRVKGELLLKQDQFDMRTSQTRLLGSTSFRLAPNTAEAQNCFQRAIEIARKQSARSLELRATMSLARLLAKQGRRDEARAMLADIYNWFTEGFDTADLRDAKALLDHLCG